MLPSVTYQNFGTKGWEPIVFDFYDVTDHFHPFDKYYNAEICETFHDDASSGMP